MELSEIQTLIKFVAKSGATEVELETQDFKITIKTPPKKKNGEPETIIQQVPVSAAIQPPVQQVPAQPAPAAPPPAEQSAPKEPAKPEKSEEDDSKYVTINSPMVGTFYRSPDPDSPVFVNVGDDIKPGKVVCIIEAMKLFNEIEAEISGKVVKVLVDDASPVEYDQPLLVIDPA